MRRVLNILSSLRLTVVLLAAAILLVFLGTIAQVHEGTWTAQKMYFQSWYIWKPTLYSQQWMIILPGGYLIGTLLLVNLILAHFRGANWSQRNVAQVLEARLDPAYAAKTVRAAAESGAQLVVMCDTNGGTMPEEIARLTKEAQAALSVPV